MNGIQYKNIIDYTMKHIDKETKTDSVKTAVEIFKNRGIEFPDEPLDYVKEILNSDNYMSWEHCEVSDLHDYANNGVAVVGIDENRVAVIAPETDDEDEEKYSNIITYSELTEADFENMSFYAATASYYGGGTVTPKESTLDKLKAKFPNGKYWNHVGMSGNNPDGYTSSPCPSHSTTETCNESSGSRQCAGFAFKCGLDATSKDPTDTKSWICSEDPSSLNNLKAGDILTLKTSSGVGTHTIYVTGVDSNDITYGDCNGRTDIKEFCIIRWDLKKTRQEISNKFKRHRSAPVKLDV